MLEALNGESYTALHSIPVVHWNQSMIVNLNTTIVPERLTIKPSVFLETLSPKLSNKTYQNEIPIPSSFHTKSPFSTQSYPRSPINIQRRTYRNDVFVGLRNFRPSQRQYLPKENTFNQDHHLEFYEGSQYVGTEGFTDPIRNETDFTVISQTT